MAGRGFLNLIKVAVLAAIAVPAMTALSSPASAQGLFDFLFGGFQPQAPAAPPSGMAPGVRHENRRGIEGGGHASESGHHVSENDSHASSGGAPSVAFCVRTCDGKYFPIALHSHASAAETCNSFCPASETVVYRGSNIDNASDAHGRRYSSLENAFAYRKHMVGGCSCNGKSGTGVAKVDVKDDPTLRKGDIVATDHGFVAYTGSRDDVAQFTPAPDYKGLGKTTQRTLAETKIRDSRETVGAAPSDDAADGRRAALQ